MWKNIKDIMYEKCVFHIVLNLREREHLLEIFKIQVDDIILPCVAEGVPMS